MQNSINPERLADVFTSLCETVSPSKKEAAVASYLKKVFAELGADHIEEDASASQTGSDSGNLLVRFASRGLELEPVFFNCHMDTVQPGENIRVKRQGGVFSSAGDTILGADDKSGIAVLIEVMRTLKEKGLEHGPVEFLFTTSEEVGLLGAKAMQFPAIQARMGYALDTTETDRVIVGAPAANRLEIEVMGLAAHAGLSPEKGINAIHLAAKAIAQLHLGRLDPESTANIGLISGGTATNIVPAKVMIHGEVRSHSEAKLAAYTEEIHETFKHAVDDWSEPLSNAAKPELHFAVSPEYPVMRLDRGAPVLARIEAAATRLGRTLEFAVAGGGSDANIFNSRGLACAIIGTGMDKVHTIDESIDLRDMVKTAELVLAVITG